MNKRREADNEIKIADEMLRRAIMDRDRHLSEINQEIEAIEQRRI